MSRENNPYRPPESSLEDSPEEKSPFEVEKQLEPAGRGSRLMASIVDGLIAMFAVLPVMYALGLFENPDAIRAQFTAFLLGFLSVILLHGYLLHTRGQTIGKVALGIQIVRIDGSRLSLAHLVFRRYLPIQALAMIPGVGSLASLLDVVFIFREDRRCIHDHIAGTIVVNYVPDRPIFLKVDSTD